MLRHIVSWKLAADDGDTKMRDTRAISAALAELVPLIPEIHSLSVSANATSVPNNWDLILVADYADEAALQRYIDHPEHQRVVKIVKPLVSARAVVDFLV